MIDMLYVQDRIKILTCFLCGEILWNFFLFMQILVGVKFLRQWPFLGRVRVCFVEPPYFQMTVKPIFGHGLDVTEIPGISGWLVCPLLFIDV
jgi:hypothetical protein